MIFNFNTGGTLYRYEWSFEIVLKPLILDRRQQKVASLPICYRVVLVAKHKTARSLCKMNALYDGITITILTGTLVILHDIFPIHQYLLTCVKKIRKAILPGFGIFYVYVTPTYFLAKSEINKEYSNSCPTETNAYCGLFFFEATKACIAPVTYRLKVNTRTSKYTDEMHLHQ